MSDKKIFYKKLFTLVLPIAFQNFMTAAVSASDAIMLGVISQEALSAVSLAGQIQFVLSLFLAAQSWQPNTGEKGIRCRWRKYLPLR